VITRFDHTWSHDLTTWFDHTIWSHDLITWFDHIRLHKQSSVVVGAASPQVILWLILLSHWLIWLVILIDQFDSFDWFTDWLANQLIAWLWCWFDWPHLSLCPDPSFQVSCWYWWSHGAGKLRKYTMCYCFRTEQHSTLYPSYVPMCYLEVMWCAIISVQSNRVQQWQYALMCSWIAVTVHNGLYS